MKNRKIKIGIILGIVVAGAAFVAVACRKESQTVMPQIRPLTEAVYASGNLYPDEEYKVFANVNGYLTKALVTEGDSVTKNMALFLISGPNREVDEQSTLAIYEISRENASRNAPAIQELENRLGTALLKTQNDSLQARRYDNLYESKAVSKSEWERVKLQYEVSRNEAQQLRAQIRSRRNAANVELRQAQSQYLRARNNQQDGVLSSFLNGRIYEIYKQPGDAVHTNEPIALAGSSRFIARLSIDESDYSKVKKGQKVLIAFDAMPDQTFPAHIHKIYPKLNRVEQSFRADAVFEQPVPMEIYGLNLEANIIIKETEEALTIPRAALLKGDSVWVEKGGTVTKIAIRTGLADRSNVEVLEGLDVHARLIINN
ncbi:MAG: efflux RND transporter periplasmic adaptor subunit [Saprospiraceae bacterium]|nr:efflux RND transporter periplasmic adaptor subunit [Saprospiraceae bacterium]